MFEYTKANKNSDSTFPKVRGFDRMLKRSEVAEILRISERQVCRLEKRGILPRIEITKNIVRYQPEDLSKIISERKVEKN
jgi:hypothetical protein